MRTLMLCCVLTVAACGAAAEDPGGGVSDTDTDTATSGDTDTAGQDTWGTSWGGTADTTPWNIDTEDPPATTAPLTTGGDASDTEGEEETDSEGKKGEEEDFIGWFGYGTVVPGESYDAGGEVIVFIDDVDYCILIWSATSVPSDACAECEGAFTMTIDNVEVEVEEDCSMAGTSSKMLGGSSVGVGWNGEQLYVDFGDGFALAEGGFAEYVEERQEFFWELPLVE